MLEMAGQDESGLDQLARVGFSTLGLQTYLTAGPKETRAWTIPVGATATWWSSGSTSDLTPSRCAKPPSSSELGGFCVSWVTHSHLGGKVAITD